MSTIITPTRRQRPIASLASVFEEELKLINCLTIKQIPAKRIKWFLSNVNVPHRKLQKDIVMLLVTFNNLSCQKSFHSLLKTAIVRLKRKRVFSTNNYWNRLS